jgi:hypothetical protein
LLFVNKSRILVENLDFKDIIGIFIPYQTLKNMLNKELLRERPITIIEGLPHTQLEDVAETQVEELFT